jgi:hypothetical protein
MKINVLELITFLLPAPILFTAFVPPESRGLLLLRVIGSILIVWFLLVIDRYIQNPIAAAHAAERGETDFDPSWGNLSSIVFGWIPASVITGIFLLVRFLWFRYFAHQN